MASKGRNAFKKLSSFAKEQKPELEAQEKQKEQELKKIEELKYPILARFNSLYEKFSHTEIATEFSHVRVIPNLQQSLDYKDIYQKQDCSITSNYGGIEIRKYEVILYDAIQKKKQFITYLKPIEFYQLKDIVCLAFCAYRNDIKLRISILDNIKSITGQQREYLKYLSYFKAEIHLVNSAEPREAKEDEFIISEDVLFKGQMGYVNAAFEYKEEITINNTVEPDIIFVPGLQFDVAASLVIGLILSEIKKAQLYIVNLGNLTKKDLVAKAMRIYNFIKTNTSEENLLNITEEDIEKRCNLINGYQTKCFSDYTKEGQSALKALKDSDELILNPECSAKVMAAIIDLIKMKKLQEQVILFWSTDNAITDQIDIDQWQYNELPVEFQKYFNDSIPLTDETVIALAQGIEGIKIE